MSHPAAHPISLEMIKARWPMRAVLAGAGSTEDKPGYFKCPLQPAQGSGSLHLRDAETRWYCFSCGRGGDALDLIAELRGVALPEAIKLLRAEWDASLPPVAHGGARMNVVSANPAPTKDDRPPIDVAALWSRCMGMADGAPWSHPALELLAKRFTSKAAALAIAKRWVGVMPGGESDRWIRSRQAEGYLLALPLHAAPEVEMGGTLPSLEIPTPNDLAMRWVASGAATPPDQKVLRVPRACKGRTVFFGWLPAAMAEAEGGDLYIGEGWADSLSLRAAADGRLAVGTIGIVSCASAKRSGLLLRAEIDAARLLGRRGPKRIRLCAQNDAPSRDGMKRIAAELHGLPDVLIGMAEAPRA